MAMRLLGRYVLPFLQATLGGSDRLRQTQQQGQASNGRKSTASQPRARKEDYIEFEEVR